MPFIFLLSSFYPRTSRLTNSSGKSGQPCLAPDLKRKAFSLSALSVMFAVGLSDAYFFLLCRGSFLLPSVCWVFYHKRCWILSSAFYASVEMILYFPLHSINVVCYIHWFSYHFFHPCVLPGDLPWLWCTIVIIYCWIQFASILMRIFVRDWMLFH